MTVNEHLRFSLSASLSPSPIYFLAAYPFLFLKLLHKATCINSPGKLFQEVISPLYFSSNSVKAMQPLLCVERKHWKMSLYFSLKEYLMQRFKITKELPFF